MLISMLGVTSDSIGLAVVGVGGAEHVKFSVMLMAPRSLQDAFCSRVKMSCMMGSARST